MQYDIIIIGGGIVGASLAAACKMSGKKIALIDARMPSNDDPRLFALNHSSCQFLKNLDIWPALAPHAAPIHQVHVSQKGHFGSVRLRREEANVSALGHVIPAAKVEAALNAALSALTDITIYRPAKLTALTQDQGVATLTVACADSVQTLQSPLVIGADGTTSMVREQAQIAAQSHDYQQTALVTRTLIQRSHAHIAYERFTKNGAIAMLPLANAEQHECATIWSIKNEDAEKLMTLSDEEFLQTLQKEFGYRLGRLRKISTRHVFPLRMMRAEKAVDQCVLLLGNALHTLHPIAAQGFNLALYEVAALAESLQNTQSTAENYKNHRAHRETANREHRSVAPFAALFAHPSLLTSLVTQFGMTTMDALSPLKKIFINHMMGKTGAVPRLLLGANE